MRSKHLALALLTVTIWGLNFVFIQIALRTVPPIFLSFLRFLLVAAPAVFFVRRPRIPIGSLALYGLSMFALQFGFLFSGMRAGVPAGVASLVHQLQVFFTMGLAVWVFGDRPHPTRWLGALIAFGGVGIVGLHTHGDVSGVGLVLLMLGSMSWAVGNITAKRAGAVNPFALVIWGSAVALGPLLALSLAVEGPHAIGAALASMSLGVAGAVAFIAYASTLVAFSFWALLLHRYPPSTVAPFTLLVPVVGFVGSMLLLGEGMPAWKIGAAALVLIGLGLNNFGARVAAALPWWRRAEANAVP
jgi:O-acetylserine/cysteine efflux transporter